LINVLNEAERSFRQRFERIPALVANLIPAPVDGQVRDGAAVDRHLPDVPVVGQEHRGAVFRPSDRACRRLEDVVVVFGVDERDRRGERDVAALTGLHGVDVVVAVFVVEKRFAVG
jgi:hypothetical protein